MKPDTEHELRGLMGIDESIDIPLDLIKYVEEAERMWDRRRSDPIPTSLLIISCIQTGQQAPRAKAPPKIVDWTTVEYGTAVEVLYREVWRDGSFLEHSKQGHVIAELVGGGRNLEVTYKEIRLFNPLSSQQGQGYEEAPTPVTEEMKIDEIAPEDLEEDVETREPPSADIGDPEINWDRIKRGHEVMAVRDDEVIEGVFHSKRGNRVTVKDNATGGYKKFHTSEIRVVPKGELQEA